MIYTHKKKHACGSPAALPTMQKCTGSRALARHVRSGASRSCFFGPRGGSRLRTSVLLRSLRSTGPPTEARRRARRTGSRALCGNGGAHRAAEGGRARKATPAREAGGGRRRMRISAEARPATRPTRERRAVRLHACNDMRLGLQEWLIWYARRSCHGRRAPWAPHRPNASICKTTERRRDLCRR